MAFPLLPLLLFGSAAVVLSGKKKPKKSKQSKAPTYKYDPKCGGIDILNARATDKNTVARQVLQAVKTAQESGYSKINPPASFGLKSEIGKDTEDKKALFGLAVKAYRSFGCGDPPPPGNGTIQQRALFSSIYGISLMYAQSDDVWGSWLPDDYVFRGLPQISEPELMKMLLNMSAPASFLSTEVQDFNLFRGPWLTKLEHRLLLALCDFHRYNKGGSIQSKSMQIPALVGTKTPPDDDPTHFLWIPQWMIYKETGKVAPPEMYELLISLGMRAETFWEWSTKSKHDYVEIACDPGEIPCSVRADHGSLNAVLQIAKSIQNVTSYPRLDYTGDLEAQAAAALLIATDRHRGAGPDRIVGDFLLADPSDEFVPNREITPVPSLYAIIKTAPMSEQRSFATSALFINEPILARLWSITVDKLIELEGEVAFK